MNFYRIIEVLTLIFLRNFLPNIGELDSLRQEVKNKDIATSILQDQLSKAEASMELLQESTSQGNPILLILERTKEDLNFAMSEVNTLRTEKMILEEKLSIVKVELQSSLERAEKSEASIELFKREFKQNKEDNSRKIEELKCIISSLNLQKEKSLADSQSKDQIIAELQKELDESNALKIDLEAKISLLNDATIKTLEETLREKETILSDLRFQIEVENERNRVLMATNEVSLYYLRLLLE